MLRAGRQFALVDAIWAAACDARWHTLEEMAKRVHSPDEEIALAVNFLERYGFARSSLTDKGRFRINPGAPSPMETAHSLRSLLRGRICS